LGNSKRQQTPKISFSKFISFSLKVHNFFSLYQTLYIFLRYLLVLRRRACENFFRPRADSTLDVTDSSLFCHARVGEGKGNFQFPLPSWRKKILA
jgi:hypothetical protein